MTRRHLFAWLIAVAIVGFGSACSATSPSSTLGPLSIQGPEALRTGESIQFRAMRTRKDGSQEEVVGQWSVIGQYMTVQSATGLAVAGSPGIAELRASVDGIAAVRAVRVVPDMRGTWTGTAVFSCTSGVTRITGAGPGPCKTPTLTHQTILGAPEQAGDTLAGIFTILGDISGAFKGPVGIDGSGEWPDFIATAISSHGPQTDYIFKGWHMSPQLQSGQMSGSGSVEHKHTNAWGFQHYRFRNVSMTLQRYASGAR